MWIIAKTDNSKINFLLKNLNNKLGSNIKLYIPKIKVQSYKNNKLRDKIVNILGDYIFVNHDSFKNSDFINYVRNIKGLKHVLSGHKESQLEITNFITKCKNLENNDGLMAHDLYDLDLRKKYCFSSGPLTGKLFNIIDFNKKNLNILIGKFKTKLNRKNFIFKPV
jgi:hypothetical protein